jgi:hypothetical protein
VWAAAVSFPVLGTIAYHKMLVASFSSDDFALIEAAQQGELLPSVDFFRPLVMLSYMIDLEVWGPNPAGFHLTNLLLHSINAFLVAVFADVALGLFSFEQRRRLIAGSSGLLFLVFPSHTESVSWVAGRTDVIATLFALGALIGFCLFLSRSSHRFFLVSIVSFCLALGSKESALALPLLILALGLAWFVSTRKTDVLKVVALTFVSFVAVTCGYLVIRKLMVGTLAGEYGISASSLGDFPSLLFWFFVVLVKSSVVVSARFVYHFLFFNQGLIIALYFLVLLVLVVVFLIWKSKKALILLLFIACHFVALIPGVGVYVELTTCQGERLTYLATVFSCIGLTFGLLTLLKPIWLGVVVLSAYSAFSVFELHRKNQIWFTAGRICTTIVEEISSLPMKSRILVLNLPDHLNGAYVFRNGFWPALRAAQWPGKVSVLSRQRIGSLSDGIRIERLEERTSGYELSLTGKRAAFLTVVESKDVVIEERARTRIRFSLANRAAKLDLFAYHQGHIIELAFSNGRTSSEPTPETDVALARPASSRRHREAAACRKSVAAVGNRRSRRQAEELAEKALDTYTVAVSRWRSDAARERRTNQRTRRDCSGRVGGSARGIWPPDHEASSVANPDTSIDWRQFW